jgi:hypothetical protein
MKEEIIAYLGINYKKGDDKIIENYISDYSDIVADNTNRKINDKKLFPYIKTAVISAYIRRGNEGSSSSSEGGLTASYVDIEDKLVKDTRHLRVIK